VDAIIVTDHNVLVSDIEGYFQNGDRRILMLVGEEVHNQARDPQKNHLLVFGAKRELATFAQDPQRLIDAVRQAEGICFLAHPYEDALQMFDEDAIGWVDWDVHGYNGIELWNGLSELKSVVTNRLSAIFYAFFPQYIARGPQAQTLEKWDQLLSNGQRTAVVGGSDAHRLPVHMGPFSRTIFPYEYHFGAINNHLLTAGQLSGDLIKDRKMILDALGAGNSFIGYDLPASTRGFRFTAHGTDRIAIPGQEISLQGSVTLQIRMPMQAECRLIRNGEVVKVWDDREICAYNASQPGAYRVECYIRYLGRRRGWIFSNPIYVRSKKNGLESR
jgi:hypothetical protein